MHLIIEVHQGVPTYVPDAPALAGAAGRAEGAEGLSRSDMAGSGRFQLVLAAPAQARLSPSARLAAPGESAFGELVSLRGAAAMEGPCWSRGTCEEDEAAGGAVTEGPQHPPPAPLGRGWSSKVKPRKKLL